MPCIFCKIAAGESPATILYKDELVTAFRDIPPAAPVHVLIIPNKHIESVNAVEKEDEPMLGHLFSVARKIAETEGIAGAGYRLISNTGSDAGQTVHHIHMHILGGHRMKHPMG